MNAEAMSMRRSQAPSRWRALLSPAGTVLASVAAAAIVLAAKPGVGGGLPLPPCPVHWLFGIDCPGCGGTRMVFNLLRGDLPSALHDNAVAMACIPLFLWSWGARVLGRWRNRRVRTWEHWRWTPRVAMIVVAVWTVVRNLPFEPFSSLWV